MSTPVARRSKAEPLPGIEITICKNLNAEFTVEKDCPLMVTAYNIDEAEYEVRMMHTGCAFGEKSVNGAAGEPLLVNADSSCVVLTAAGRYKFVAKTNGANYSSVSFEASYMTPAQVELMCNKGVGFSVS